MVVCVALCVSDTQCVSVCTSIPVDHRKGEGQNQKLCAVVSETKCNNNNKEFIGRSKERDRQRGRISIERDITSIHIPLLRADRRR